MANVNKNYLKISSRFRLSNKKCRLQFKITKLVSTSGISRSGKTFECPPLTTMSMLSKKNCNMDDPHLITTYNLKGREFLIKMNVINNTLNILITDKCTGEEWENNYEASYIENLTQRTGNYKQFNIFMAMLKAGFLKTSDCISLDLLTFEDLETLKLSHKRKSKFCQTSTFCATSNLNSQQYNRRYLIMTYSVEFDRIHYPLPLEYCGPPDPQVLQANIRRLESEIERLQNEISENSNTNVYVKLQQKIKNLTDENFELKCEVDRLRQPNVSDKNLESFHIALAALEQSVIKERKSHTKLVQELRNENEYLKKQILNLHEKLRSYTTTPRQISSPSSELLLPNSKIDLVFLQKQVSTSGSPQSVQNAGDHGGKCRSKYHLSPVRPEVNKIESWETTVRRQNIVQRSRQHCRNSSKESKRSENDCQDFHICKIKSCRGGGNRSRSASNCSRKSCSSTSTNKSQTKSKRRKFRTTFENKMNTRENKNYENLENRITALQKILSDGLSI